MRNELLLQKYFDTACMYRRPASVMIELLTKCNLNCRHCYIPEHNKKGLTTNEIKRMIQDFRNNGVMNISLTGGEIFLREDLLEIIAFIRSLHMRVFLLSNASMLTETIVKQLSNLYITELSTTIFSMDPEIHDNITTVKGSLKKTLKGIQLLKKYGIHVKIKMPIMEINAFEGDKIQEYCIENGFEFYRSAVIMAKTNGDRKPLALSILESSGNDLIPQLDSERPASRLPEYPCEALRYSLAVDCNGDVYPCNSYYYKLGNVLEKNMNEIWNSKDYIMLQNIRIEDLACFGCELKKFCYRCPGLGFQDSRNHYGCDLGARKHAQIRRELFYEENNFEEKI